MGGSFGNQEAQASGEQCPAHVGECEEKQGAPSVGVDRPDSRPREDEIDKAKSPGSEQCARDGCASLRKDRGRVKSDDVDYKSVNC